MVEVVPTLYLCECSSYGELASRKGAVDEARALIDKEYGSIANLRLKLEEAERKRKEERDQARRQRSEREHAAIRRG
jgi:hypothetical protein